jgi:hypothetical protein
MGAETVDIRVCIGKPAQRRGVNGKHLLFGEVCACSREHFRAVSGNRYG